MKRVLSQTSMASDAWRSVLSIRHSRGKSVEENDSPVLILTVLLAQYESRRVMRLGSDRGSVTG